MEGLDGYGRDARPDLIRSTAGPPRIGLWNADTRGKPGWDSDWSCLSRGWRVRTHWDLAMEDIFPSGWSSSA